MLVGIISIYTSLYFSEWLTSVLHSSACLVFSFMENSSIFLEKVKPGLDVSLLHLGEMLLS